MAMYDRLGDLLNETLEAGHVKFVRIDKNEKTQDFKERETSEKKIGGEKKTKGEIFRTLTKEELNDYKILGLDWTNDLDVVKQAFKTKIKYYHPDKWQKNADAERIAKEKTTEIVAAFERISKKIKG